jgi:hypothetical protein
VEKKSRKTVWVSGGCSSYYLDRNGKNSTIWPGFTFSFLRRARQVRAGDFRFEPLRGPATVTAEELIGS